ncbi:hypothetical protein [Brevundimonas aurifodinae]|uniref:DUF2530 domain-containing protein n=2 Tax=Brevundimonas TaxID=41275 RepID=A0ABV1NSM4_9CAUL|nr:MAG: hypothetical protein B7Z42_12625 [Brevundimonas sp. 12-68-7]OYX33874.1 MAG: hypothetical protein B7Z01_07800 [Brevundimonas subvibrioides]
MTQGDTKPRQGRRAVAGATVAIGLVWLAVVGLHLYWRNWEEAVLWAAIAVATMAASFAGLPGFRRKS